MRSNKKGFTIVELVIVIAVIAILAAVLIPTVAGLVKKAQQSADIQAVRQMNVALASATKAPEGPAEVASILSANGFNTEKGLTPAYKGYSYYWHKPTNQIVYVNDADGKFELIFPEKVKDFNKDGCVNVSISILPAAAAPKVTVTDADVDKTMNTMIPENVVTFDDLMAYVTTDSDKHLKHTAPNGAVRPGIAINGGDIKLTEDIVLDVANTAQIGNSGNTLMINIYDEVTIDLAGHSITQVGDGASLNLFAIRAGATLNIIDSIGGGAIYASLGTFQIDAGATVNFFSGKLAVTATENRSDADIAYGFSAINMNGGTFNMYGGTIDTTSDSADYYEFAFSGYAVDTSVVNIYDGTITTNNHIEGDRAGTVNDFR